MADEPWMQDWPLLVADPARVEEFIELYEASTEDEERFALMELVLCSLDEMPDAGKSLWPRVEELLVIAGPLHAYPVIEWSCVEEETDGSWTLEGEDDGLFAVTPLARRALLRLREEIQFTELWLPADSFEAVLGTRAAGLASQHLEALLANLEQGSSLPETEVLHQFLSAMERVVADALRARFDELKRLTIDGFRLERTTVTGPGKAELLGLCYLLPDSPLAPICVRVVSRLDGIAWIQCKLGERDSDTGKFEPVPPNQAAKESHRLGQRDAEIEWAYEVEIGDKATESAEPSD
ncbi:MAG: hypothetical protein DRJ42_21565 [Deltaproteobacteria bacterium]|nr:MAG: hypothetical protein DRJ42_21565 [Deltaproteobacteria bacterium]